MEANALVSKIEEAVPGAILQKRPFGRLGELSLWVEADQLPAVASFVQESALIRLDWLEHIAVAEIEGALLLTYFVRSASSDRKLILRASVAPATSEAEVRMPSVRSVWPMAAPIERELSELFGIAFEGRCNPRPVLLPEGWEGYPLRKSYVFPVEFANVSHMRLAGSSAGSEGEI